MPELRRAVSVDYVPGVRADVSAPRVVSALCLTAFALAYRFAVAYRTMKFPCVIGSAGRFAGGVSVQIRPVGSKPQEGPE